VVNWRNLILGLWKTKQYAKIYHCNLKIFFPFDFEFILVERQRVARRLCCVMEQIGQQVRRQPEAMDGGGKLVVVVGLGPIGDGSKGKGCK